WTFSSSADCHARLRLRPRARARLRPRYEMDSCGGGAVGEKKRGPDRLRSPCSVAGSCGPEKLPAPVTREITEPGAGRRGNGPGRCSPGGHGHPAERVREGWGRAAIEEELQRVNRVGEVHGRAAVGVRRFQAAGLLSSEEEPG